MAERDQRDSTRAEAPLMQAPDAVYLDTTDLSIEQVVDEILKLTREPNHQRQRDGATVKDLLVMKFGGTSMGSAERIRTAARSRSNRSGGPVVIVVSAMSKITDLLLETLTHAELGRPDVEANLKKLKQRHFEACEQLLPVTNRAQMLARMESIMSEFQRIAHGILMLGERPPRSVDEAIATGEKLSALLISEYLNTQGVKSVAGQRQRGDRHRQCVRQRDAAHGPDRGEGAREAPAVARTGRAAHRDRLQRRNRGRQADHPGPRRIGLFGVHPGRGARRLGAVDLDRRGRHHDRPTRAWCRTPLCSKRSPTTRPRSSPMRAPKCCIPEPWRR